VDGGEIIMPAQKDKIIKFLLNMLEIPLPRMEVHCRKCGQWHAIVYGVNEKTGKEENLLMGFTCGKTSYLCGVAGNPIDGLHFRKARNNA
jgi:hypothetical protein